MLAAILRLHKETNQYLTVCDHLSQCLTSGIHKAQLTWTHLVPLRVGLSAPPLLGQSRHFGWTPRAQVRHSQFPWGTFRMP